MKRENTSHLCSGSFAIASPTFTRADMVRLIYKELGIDNEYVVGVQVGPPFKASFTGMRYVSHSSLAVGHDLHKHLVAVKRKPPLLNRMKIGKSFSEGFS